MSEGTRARGRLTPAPFAIPRDGGSIPPISTTQAPTGCCSGARSGDGGFTLACISGRSGVVGFNIATSPRPVREKVRPARPDRGSVRDKVRPARSKHPKFEVFEVAGRILSRVEWGRGRAGRILSRLSAHHRPRNSPWPDTTPALPAPGGPAAWPVGTAISHAIPQQLVQTLNLHRWNCNVFWVC